MAKPRFDYKSHYKKQQVFFDNEFAKKKIYTLDAWQQSYIERIRTHLLGEKIKGKTVIDIGTGEGYVAIELAKLGLQVIACDLSPQAIANLEKAKIKLHLKNLQTLVCNAEEIPLKSGSVDYLVANALLEHLPNEQKAINNWKRILRKGGKMFITVPLSLRFVWPFLWPMVILYDRRLGHLRRYDAESLRRKFKLTPVKIFYTGYLLKVIGVLMSVLLRTHAFDEFLERLDKRSQGQYGANNISIIFEK